MSAANLAYVAGLIDGEGCIHLENSRTTYRPRVSVGMTEPALQLLRELHEEWGGTLYQQRAATDRWAAAWTWHSGGPWAARLLREIFRDLVLRLHRHRAARRQRDDSDQSCNTLTHTSSPSVTWLERRSGAGVSARLRSTSRDT